MTILQISLQYAIEEYPCNAHSQNIPAMPQKILILSKISCNIQLLNILAMPIRNVSLQRPNSKYPCNAQLQNIPEISRLQISLQDPIENILVISTRRISLEYPAIEYQYSCSAFAILQGRRLRETRKRYISCTITAVGREYSK